VVLELAPQAGLDAVEEPITPARLMAAAEVFITSSTLRVAPVISLDGRPVGGGRPGPVVERLQALFEARVEAEVAHRR
jgi:D-alanine transaminase